MNSLFSLFKGSGKSPADSGELASLPFGSLHITIRGVKACLYPDAALSIRSAGEKFQYHLVCSKAYEQDQSNEDEDEDDERVFLLDKELKLHANQTDGVQWFDAESGESYAFVPTPNGKSERDQFEMQAWKCMFERSHRKVFNDAFAQDLEEFVYVPGRVYPAAAVATPAGKNMQSSGERVARTGVEVDALADAFAQQAKVNTPARPVAQTPVKKEAVAKQEKQFQPEEQSATAMISAAPENFDRPPADAIVLFASNASLYLYNKYLDNFVQQEEGTDVAFVRSGKNSYFTWLTVESAKIENKFWLAQPVDSRINSKQEQASSSFMWNQFIAGQTYTWLLRFEESDSFNQFTDMFARYMWEGLHLMSWDKVGETERKFVKTSYEDIEMGEPEVEEGEEEESEDEEVERQLEEDEEQEELTSRGLRQGSEDDSSEEDGRMPQSSTLNSQLAVGMKTDRSFIVRGDSVGVFKQDENDNMKFVANISKISTPSGRNFAPGKVMLHDQDTSMLLMDKANPNSIYNLDVEYGKIVDEWKVSDNIAVNSIAPDSKFAQATAQKTFIGTSHNGLFRIDPRLGGNKLVESQYKQYAGKNEFSAASTSAKGQIAVASNKGDIRLFDSIGKNAKTALPALGDPIIGVDVSKDGRWIIATCKTYLLLIDTLIGEGRYKGSSGFDRSFPADAKPIPRRLTLKPEHVAFMEEELSFTPARFNTGEDEEEKTIVTSTGPYVVSFNFRRIKQGRLDDYQIKRYADTVVADNFKFGNDRKIIVTLPHDVLMVNKTSLASPTRKSLSTPIKALKTRSSIVDQRY